jgi:putative cardiolipin synthase
MSLIKSVFVICLVTVLASCASLPKDYERHVSHALEDTSDTPFSRAVIQAVKDHPGETGVYMLDNGKDAFVARIKLIEHAERSLDVQYYIWHEDLTGKVMHDRLLAAADRGVRVRLLLDDLDTAGKEANLVAMDSHPNLEIRLYNPFANRKNRFLDFASDLGRVNRRMHNKSLTADNMISIAGGRNIGDEYFGAQLDVDFSDLDMMAIGAVVKDISSAFDLYWNSDYVIPLSAFATKETVRKNKLAALDEELDKFLEEARNSSYAQALRESDLVKKLEKKELQFFWGKAVLIYDHPSKVEASEVQDGTHMALDLKKVMDETQRELIIISPYFVPGHNFVNYLTGLVKKGVNVKILTNSLAANDVPIVFSGYKGYRWDLIRGGVELYEFKPLLTKEEKKKEDKEEDKIKKSWIGSSRASLHAKSLGFDRQKIFVGSFNVDPRSVVLNTEMGIIFENEHYAQKLGTGFEKKIMTLAYQLKIKEIPSDDALMDSPVLALEWVTMEGGKEVRYNNEPETTWWQRFLTGFMALLPLESQL